MEWKFRRSEVGSREMEAVRGVREKKTMEGRRDR